MPELATASMAGSRPESAGLDDQLPSLRDLQTAEQMELLDKVDQLRAHGLNEIMALPQLIVCGDQSSGKSSVLEAISGVPFPRKDNICTRFATELILRRAPLESTSVSITPGQDRNETDRERLAKFQHRLISTEDFPLLFERAKEAMGLGDGGKSFSKDILRVEKFGPLQPQLTLVDLPGFIHAAIRGQTDNDIVLVNDLIASYLENPRSIILAVVSAKSDIGNQVVLTKARKVDPEGKRTLGIITKPDLLATNSDSEKAYIALARNSDIVFNLGWHVVKNIDSMSERTQHQTRDELEVSFFRTSNFNTLPSTSVGVASLRSRLSQVLFNQLRVELPRLLEEIELKMKRVKDTRDQLGEGRLGLAEQKQFLINTSQRFAVICEHAAKGYYDDPFFKQGLELDQGLESERRLCAVLRNKHTKFAENLRERGAHYKIVDNEAITEEDGSEDNYSDDSYEEVRKRTRDEAIKSACEKVKTYRGRELPGLPNPFVVGELFREYSQPWEGLAREHIKDVWDATNKFIEIALESLVGADVADKIFGFWLNPIMEQKLAAANMKLDELLEVYRDEPMTTNHHFIKARKEIQERRFKDHFKQILESRLTRPGQKILSEDIPQIISTIPSEISPDMDMVAAEDAFDTMNAFYKVAMDLFMDNVPTLAIQGPIVRQIPTIFRPADIDKMSPELVARIAAESEEKTRIREEALSTLAKMEEGARICKQNIPRSRHNRTNYTTNRRASNVGTRNSEGSREISFLRNSAEITEPRQILSTTARPQSQTHSPGFANTLRATTPDPPQIITHDASNTSNDTDHRLPYFPARPLENRNHGPLFSESFRSSLSTAGSFSGPAVFATSNSRNASPSSVPEAFGSSNSRTAGPSSFPAVFRSSNSTTAGPGFQIPESSTSATPPLFSTPSAPNPSSPGGTNGSASGKSRAV